MCFVSWKDDIIKSSFAGFLVGFGYSIGTIYLNQYFSSLIDSIILGSFLFILSFIAGGIIGLLSHSILVKIRKLRLPITPKWIDSTWVTGFIFIFSLALAKIYCVGIYPDDWFWSSPWMSLLAWLIRLILYFIISVLAARALSWLILQVYKKTFLKTMIPACLILLFLFLCLYTSRTRQGPLIERIQSYSPVTPHIALVGLDGIDYDLLQDFISKERMPNFESIISDGTIAPLKTLRVASSPRIWTTIATGKGPLEHGILDHVENKLIGMKDTFFFPAHTGANHLFAPILQRFGLIERTVTTNIRRRVPTIWSIASNFGKSVAVINWMCARPAENINGYFISADAGMLIQDVHINSKKSEIMGLAQKLMGYVYPVNITQDLIPLGKNFSFLEATRVIMDKKEKTNLLAIYDGRVDGIGHRYWQYYEPEKFFGIDKKDVEKYKNTIPEIYETMDTWIGELREMLPTNICMVIVSDHGFGAAFLESLTFKGGHNNAPEGVIILSGNSIAKGATINKPHVYDIAPTVLYLMGMPNAKDMKGRVLMEALDKNALQTHPQRWIKSYGAWKADSPTGIIKNKVIEKKELEKLKALGYIK